MKAEKENSLINFAFVIAITKVIKKTSFKQI
jgi:hypothetical protein